MSKAEIQRTAMPQLPVPGRVGQGTAVEQSRAVAQVHAMILVAQQCPRDVQTAKAQMEDSCRQMYLAERAFYEFRRGGSPVSGPSIHLARELARCWGNVEYGLVEMRRDDDYAQSEMQAFAWDVQTNTRNSSTFVVPHKRDKRGGPERLTEMRDIYENNANNGSRRVREAIFAVLPPWFIEQAKDLCAKTLENGGGIPLANRITEAIEKFAELDISKKRLEERVGSPSSEWTARDVSQLGVTYSSITRGEIRKDEAFPTPQLSAEDITTPPPGPAPATDAPAGRPWPPTRTPGGE
ncbi:hypothetical protein NE236_41575 [Actinoallomurus purpureus]|uniref:hypothetical protein n=1 Tax=Actinoallomurus purpureus TaxID=478114 RepID=UPI002092814B|nr:hypothetical protein [Actinoallomurus purpureus]MCO6011460.1 hypothetical protein [Actinoallomurus purpureus]